MRTFLSAFHSGHPLTVLSCQSLTSPLDRFFILWINSPYPMIRVVCFWCYIAATRSTLFRDVRRWKRLWRIRRELITTQWRLITFFKIYLWYSSIYRWHSNTKNCDNLNGNCYNYYQVLFRYSSCIIWFACPVPFYLSACPYLLLGLSSTQHAVVPWISITAVSAEKP